MTDFYNPYNFIPATGKIDGQPSARTPYADLKTDENKHCRHDLWAKDAHSGRIVCRLRLETPTVVGALQEGQDGESKRGIPYTRGEQAAIPGSSLRGMVGSVVETLSQSALRVLDDRGGKPYSYRVPVDRNAAGEARPLSAIGMLKTSKTNPEGFDLIPLTLPTLRTQGSYFRLPEIWQKAFEDRDLSNCLFAYINGYNTEEPKSYKPDSFLAGARHPSLSPSNLKYYHAKSACLSTLASTDEIPINVTGLNVKPRGNSKFLLGQTMAGLIPETDFKALESTQQSQYTQGFLRILGIEGREKDIPGTKKHELFIPKPKNTKRLPVPDEVIQSFVRLGEEREEASKDKKGKLPPLPFHLQGYDSNDPKRWRPQDWLLVYFDVKPDKNNNPVVSEISLSAIWRREADASPHQFFTEIDTNLLPWQAQVKDKKRQRSKLTPAETLLGFVAEGKEESEKNAPALASRIRFSDAFSLTKPACLDEVCLKILSSPKPPSPAMYFHKTGNGPRYVRKPELSKETCRPNGRKIYLHHPKEIAAAQGRGRGQHWETANPNERPEQKLLCSPLKAGQDFFFHIDFDNLSNAELSLLLAALKPSQDFLHRLGLGKPLGLGSVGIDIEGVFFINRQKRYGLDALQSPKYHSAWRADAAPFSPSLFALYPDEAKLKPEATLLENAGFYSREYIDSTTRRLLATAGELRHTNANIPVHTPLVRDQTRHLANREDETFKWFAANEIAQNQQALQPIVQDRELPSLRYES